MKVIDVNDINTYPKEFIDFMKKEKETLNNTFKGGEISMSYECYLFEHIDAMFDGFYFKCIHASRVNDINDIYNEGILLPSNSDELVNIILNPIKNQLGQDYTRIKGKLSEDIKHKKYQTLHYVIGGINDITISNYFLMLDKYGGELLEDIMYDDTILYNKIVNFGKPVAVLFGLNNKQIRPEFLAEIYSYMLEKLLYSAKKHFFRESWIYETVKSNEIIEVKELMNYD